MGFENSKMDKTHSFPPRVNYTSKQDRYININVQNNLNAELEIYNRHLLVLMFYLIFICLGFSIRVQTPTSQVSYSPATLNSLH